MVESRGGKDPKHDVAKKQGAGQQPGSSPAQDATAGTARGSRLGSRRRYLGFLLIVLVAVALDQGTKVYADRWLASPQTLPEYPAHPVEIVVQPGDADRDLRGILADRFTGSTPEEIDQILRRHLLVDGNPPPHPSTLVPNPGQKLTVLEREVTVIPGFWHHRFVRNPAAAWGMFRWVDASLRRPVFIVISLLLIGVMMVILVRSRQDQHLLTVSLAVLLGGALGNLIDRIRLGFVIDFIDWFVVIGGKEHHWPTFNIADAWISIGVGLLLIEVLRGQPAQEPAKVPSPSPPARK